jgi:formylglycine-generating enzyme required for sulfatase activity
MKIFFLLLPYLFLQIQVSAQMVELDSMQMVFVQGGSYVMGCTTEQSFNCEELNEELKNKCKNNCFEWELPVHSVTLSDFYICRFEITQKQWKSVMEDTLINSFFKGDELPVESVSWVEIQQFINKLNKKTGKNYRLPTEAEWEFAARGGNKSLRYRYSGDNNIDSVAWYKENAGGCTHPVGTKKANELGAYDMSGNVWEWCNDIFTEYNLDNQDVAVESSDEKYYVLRGGSWDSGVITARVSFRYDDLPHSTNFGIGFRLALSAQ